VELHEETAMLEWCRRYGFDELADIIAVAIDSGLRRSELLKLTAQDIQDNLWAHDTKNGDSRDVPLSPRAKEILHRRKQGLPRGGKVFTLSGWQLMDQWRRAATAIGIDLEEDREFVFHICRHTFVSRALAANVDIRTVMELSGHKTMAVVQRYAHSSPARKTAAVALISGWSAAQTQQPPHAPTHV
jgi:integrase